MILQAEKLQEIKHLFKSDIFVSNSDIIGEKLQEYFDYVSSSCQRFIELSKTSQQLYETKQDINKNRLITDEFTELVTACKSAYISRMKKKSYQTAEKFYMQLLKLLDYVCLLSKKNFN